MSDKKEYIERGALLELETFLQDADGFECSAVLSVDIRSAKAADVVEVKHASWKYYKKQRIAVCTNCSFERKLDDDFGRAVSCPNCGAKMDGGADNG